MQDNWCRCETSELRTFTTSDNRKQYAKQCQTCGRRVGTAIKRDTLQFEPAPADPTLWDKYRAKQKAEYAAHRDRQKSEWWEWYSSYLLTPEWKAKRKAVFRRDGGVCQGCLERPATQIHHLNYRNAGHEPLFDLVAICDFCHDDIHPHDDTEV